MKYSDIQKLTDEELRKAESDSRHEMFELRQKAVSNTLKETAKIRSLRKDVARFETEKNARAQRVAD